MSTFKNRLTFWLNKIFHKKNVIPDIIEKRKIIEHYVEIFQPKCFIETGTFLGDTVEYFKNKIDTVISIELSQVLANKAMIRFANDKNVKIVEGDSSIVLNDLLIKLNEPVLFWLDGHYSSEFFVKDEFIRTAKGKTNTPIIEELNIIFSSLILAIILIDDARLFTGKADYPSIKEIMKLVNSTGREFNVFVFKDIIHIIPQQ